MPKIGTVSVTLTPAAARRFVTWLGFCRIEQRPSVLSGARPDYSAWVLEQDQNVLQIKQEIIAAFNKAAKRKRKAPTFDLCLGRKHAKWISELFANHSITVSVPLWLMGGTADVAKIADQCRTAVTKKRGNPHKSPLYLSRPDLCNSRFMQRVKARERERQEILAAGSVLAYYAKKFS